MAIIQGVLLCLFFCPFVTFIVLSPVVVLGLLAGGAVRDRREQVYWRGRFVKDYDVSSLLRASEADVSESGVLLRGTWDPSTDPATLLRNSDAPM
jgi:hypothetical protein